MQIISPQAYPLLTLKVRHLRQGGLCCKEFISYWRKR